MPKEKQEKIFPKGMYLGEPREGAPEYVKGALSIKVSEFVPFLELYQNNAGYVNLDLKESVGNKLYFELNTWQPKKSALKDTEEAEVVLDEDNSEIPF